MSFSPFLNLGDLRLRDLVRSSKELSQLALKAKHNRKVRDEVVLACLPIVVHIVRRRYARFSDDLRDLLLEGIVGVEEAIDAYDFKKSSFSSYVQIWIVQKVSRYVANDKLIRIPEATLKQVFKMRKARNTLMDAHGRGLNNEDLVAFLKFSDQTRIRIQFGDCMYTSLDSGGKEGDSLHELVSESPPQRELDGVELMKVLQKKEQDVLRLRFGFADGSKKTLREVAIALKKSPETIRQLEMQALRKLKKWFHQDKMILKK